MSKDDLFMYIHFSKDSLLDQFSAMQYDNKVQINSFGLVNLPTELISIIIGYLGVQDLRNLSGTCKRIKEILDYPGYWKNSRIR